MPARIEKLARGGHQLVLADGRPFFARAAELQNSSLSSGEYMEAIWQKLAAQHVNLALGAVAWEDVEPEEGKFDWKELDTVIAGATKHGVRLVLLWFSTWKNGMSTYVPHWVKKDPKRFPRARIQSAPGAKTRLTEVISPLCTEARDADTRAFTALMQHLKDVDEERGIVVMVQVENEVGLLGDSRDRSTLANWAFDGAVPRELLDRLHNAAVGNRLTQHLKDAFPFLGEVPSTQRRSWAQAFGTSLQTDELFMAYHYAKYIEYVAAAGKAVYNLPLYTNAWLRATNSATSTAGGGAVPGEYPSGGPVETVLDVWQLFAPTLSCLSPDIYLVDYEQTFRAYSHGGQPLFIPEHRRDDFGALRIWQAIGDYGALAVSPFGIDTLDPATSPWTKHYGLLRTAEAQILRARQDGRRITGFYFDRFDKGHPDPTRAKEVVMGSWRLQIERAEIFGHPEPGYGLVIQTEADDFLLVGEGFMVTFSSIDPSSGFSGIVSFDELECTDEEKGTLRRIRRLNGDESKSGRCVVMPTLGSGPDYAGYPIAITIPGETGLARCSVYSIPDPEA